MDPSNLPIIGFLHPSEMTLEERINELAAIFAAGFLALRTGIVFENQQAQSTGLEGDKSSKSALTQLDSLENPRLCASQTTTTP
jgi:uncharacterized protein (DUF2164 family)